MSHRDRFIFTQALSKTVLEAAFNRPGVLTDKGIEDETRRWTRFLYDLAGELEPKERDDDSKRMHTQTFEKYRRIAEKAMEKNDSLAVIEIRDELVEKKFYMDFLRRLYKPQENEFIRLVEEGDRLAFEQDEDYLEMQE